MQQNLKKTGPPIYQLKKGYLSEEVAKKAEDKFRNALYLAVVDYAEELLDGMRDVCTSESGSDEF